MVVHITSYCIYIQESNIQKGEIMNVWRFEIKVLYLWLYREKHQDNLRMTLKLKCNVIYKKQALNNMSVIERQDIVNISESKLKIFTRLFSLFFIFEQCFNRAKSRGYNERPLENWLSVKKINLYNSTICKWSKFPAFRGYQFCGFFYLFWEYRVWILRNSNNETNQQMLIYDIH